MKKSILVFLCLLTVSSGIFAQTKERPNIVFIFSDDHAYQSIGAYGNKFAKTPNIDRIAREGALLKNNLVTNSICGPSRATLLTGKYSHINGYKNNDRTKFDITQQLFPDLLQKGGYQTAWIGKLHLNSLPTGFDYWNILPGQGIYYNPQFITTPNDTIRKEGYVADIITETSLDWINKRDEKKPFFLVVGQKSVHREWYPDLQDLGAYDDINFPLPETFYDDYAGRAAAKDQDMTIEKTMRLKEDLKVHLDYDKVPGYKFFPEEKKKVLRDYYDKITKEFDDKKLTGKALTEWKYQRYIKDYLATANGLDRNIGKILDYLDKTGLSKNTVVIYASDQGFYMGEHGWFDKRFIYEESLKTPFVIRYPGVIKPGTKVEQLISNIDWAPTVLDLAGAKIPAEIQGKSFLPLLDKNAKANTPWRDAAYYHYYEFPEPHHVSPHFGVRTKRYKLVRFYGGSDSWELFDLEKDPHELKNVYAQKSNEAIVKSLKQQLKTLIVQYKDDEALKLFNTNN
ncbi:sulfatase [Dyadobacter frigoris]|uniref:sulfatase family protein n=1 Tax=Dyadobacter frigoris TaxID=2576211 RepID=UPI0024A03234|nr:sulfatase [Dyadobacter frigoris]GLU55372.1 sulfatase [Dyadobacter frigoris]